MAQNLQHQASFCYISQLVTCNTKPGSYFLRFKLPHCMSIVMKNCENEPRSRRSSGSFSSSTKKGIRESIKRFRDSGSTKNECICAIAEDFNPCHPKSSAIDHDNHVEPNQIFSICLSMTFVN